MLRTVKVENGIIQGLPAADPRITSFKGIPFTAPPVGDFRWKAPQPVQNWEGVLKTHDFAPISMQAKTVIDKNNIYTREWMVDPDITMNEDCLYLNVWTPANHTDEKLPVFVWYFGGALQVGHTAEMEFDGERIARRGIIVVTINYRLNVFGFFCHPEITKESPEAPANFGLLDQQAATRWVKRNISSFGGDPENITIGGQSAGGGSVMSQLTNLENDGLFQRAIVESGMLASLYPNDFMPIVRHTLEEAEKEGVKFFEFIGVKNLNEARKLDAEYLRDKCLEYRKMWLTVTDNKFVVGDAYELFIENKRLQVPVLAGHTSSEFYCTPNVKTIDDFKKMASQLFGENAEDFCKRCELEKGDLEKAKSNASVRWIEYANRTAAVANEVFGNNLPFYYYNFDAEIPGWDNPGTFHSVDLWFFFETLAKCWRPFTGKHYDLARIMCNYWSNFIKTGNPNGFDSDGVTEMPKWETFSKEKPYGMLFNDTVQFNEEEPSEMINFLVDTYIKMKIEK